MGLTDTSIKQQLLRTESLKLDKAIMLVKTATAASDQMRHITNSSSESLPQASSISRISLIKLAMQGMGVSKKDQVQTRNVTTVVVCTHTLIKTARQRGKHVIHVKNLTTLQNIVVAVKINAPFNSYTLKQVNEVLNVDNPQEDHEYTFEVGTGTDN